MHAAARRALSSVPTRRRLSAAAVRSSTTTSSVSAAGAATTWLPARLIAGRRYPPIRLFHSSRALHDESSAVPPSAPAAQPPSDPALPSDAPATNVSEEGKSEALAEEKDKVEGKELDPSNGTPAAAATAAAAAQQPANGGGPRGRTARLRDAVRQSQLKHQHTRLGHAPPPHSSSSSVPSSATASAAVAAKKRSGSNRFQDLPPVVVPQWFVEENVVLPEETELVSRLAPGWGTVEHVVRLDRLAANGEVEGQREIGRMLNLSLAVPDKDSVREEKADNEEQSGDKVWENRVAEEQRLIEDRLQKYLEAVREAGDEEGKGAKAAVNALRNLHHASCFSPYRDITNAEVRATVAACLRLPAKTPKADEYAKTDVNLYAPYDGAHTDLNALVQDVAHAEGADLIRLGPEDLAELVGNYVGNELAADSPPVMHLGYDTYALSSGEQTSRESEDQFSIDADELEDDTQADQASRDFGVGAGGLGGIIKAISIKIPGVGSQGGRSSSLGGLPFFSGSLQPMESGQAGGWSKYQDLKLTALLESLIDTPHAKRENAHFNMEALDLLDTKDETGMEGARETGNAYDVEHTIQKNHRLHWVYARRQWPQTSRTSLSPPRHPDVRKTIIQLVDSELNGTYYGAQIVEKLQDIVKRRRGNGEQIMIVGTSHSIKLFPERSKSGIVSAQSKGYDENTRTIVLPHPSFKMKMPSPHAPKRLSESAKKTLSINIRHLQHTIRYLSPETDLALGRHGGALSLADWVPELSTKVLPAEEIVRTVLVALGVQALQPQTPTLRIEHIDLALFLIRISDRLKFQWAKQAVASEALKAARHANPQVTTPTAADMAADARIAAALAKANEYEKKLASNIVRPSAIKTTFSDVHATPATIDALKTLTSLSLARPDAFSYGVLANDKIPGLLLYGPPGTGKTLLAKAVAKESGATVLEVSGSEINDKYVGEGEKNVRAIFSLARKLSPCVVFIDEADAILGSRSERSNRSSHREIINQFLKEWDGMDERSVFIMVATNRPFDLDDAVLRRLPRRLLVDLPTKPDREGILRIHLKGEQLAPDVDLSRLAEETPFFSGSDLKNLAVAAALAAVKEENAAAAAARAALTRQAEAEGRAVHPDELRALYPARRQLARRHFDAALAEIGASVSEDMSSLGAIRKFDERFGDRKTGGKRRSVGWGFGGKRVQERDVRVRDPGAAPTVTPPSTSPPPSSAPQAPEVAPAGGESK